MNQPQLFVDAEADTSPPSAGPRWTPAEYSRTLGRQRRRQMFTLFAIAVPLVSLVVGMLFGGLAALVF